MYYIMSYDYQIEDYLKPKNKNFLGCFASDELPKNPPVNSCLIVNYSKHSQDGTHWVAMMNLNTNNVMFGDSYGFEPDGEDLLLSRQTNFHNYLIRHSNNNRYTHNEYNLQDVNSDCCGEYCCKFIIDGLPADRTGKVNAKWRKYIEVNDPQKADKMILQEIRIR